MTNRRNVLLLSVGRRVELLQTFRAEIKSRSLDSRILTTDHNPQMSPACHLADQSFAMPRVTSNGYIDELIALCKKQHVGLVVPTIDTELLGLAQAREHLASDGIHVAISDESLVRTCRDKRQTSCLFTSLNIDTPRILERGLLTYPCFVKPFDGSRSVGAAKLERESDLTPSQREDPKLMFMEFIGSSFEEYTLDVYYDKSGVLKCMVPRHRLEVRDGEIIKGATRKNHVYHYLRDKLDKISGARGCLTVQLFAHPEQLRYAALEINPRFGGGYPLSYAAGANYTGWLLDEYFLERELPFFENWEPDLLMLRYDSQLLVSNASLTKSDQTKSEA